MKGGGRQTAEGRGNFLGSDGAEFGRRFAEEEIGEDGTGGDGSDATLGFEASGGDAAGFEADR